MKARYDLSEFIPSFDFFSWLVQAKAHGFDEILIDDHSVKDYKWPMAICRQRIESIIKPGPALAGLEWRSGREGKRWGNPDLSYLVAFSKSGGRFDSLKTVLPPREHVYTVTIRNTQRSKERNSNDAAWRQFARQIGAIIIDDYDNHPISLHDRMAIYAGARMNFFVVSGPSHLCSLGGYPCMIFDAVKSESTLLSNGISPGENFPWHNEQQKLIWAPDDLPNIDRHFNDWLKRGDLCAN
jgi:hypothetical protein